MLGCPTVSRCVSESVLRTASGEGGKLSVAALAEVVSSGQLLCSKSEERGSPRGRECHTRDCLSSFHSEGVQKPKAHQFESRPFLNDGRDWKEECFSTTAYRLSQAHNFTQNGTVDGFSNRWMYNTVLRHQIKPSFSRKLNHFQDLSDCYEPSSGQIRHVAIIKKFNRLPIDCPGSVDEHRPTMLYTPFSDFNGFLAS